MMGIRCAATGIDLALIVGSMSLVAFTLILLAKIWVDVKHMGAVFESELIGQAIDFIGTFVLVLH